jgi:hypothetical protein
MLPGEFSVTARTSTGLEFSLFAPEQYVVPDKGLMAVTVVATEAGQSLVSLPVEPFEMSRTVTVRSNDLVTQS